MRNSKLFVLLSVLAISFAAIDDCTYDVYGSESDSQVHNYQYCDVTTHERTSQTAAKITARLKGPVHTCNMLEPNLSDDELYDKLGIRLRPFFKAIIMEDNTTETGYSMGVGQYGDENCLAAQRLSSLPWGRKFCKKGASSQGYIHDIYFTSSDCAGLAEMSSIERQSIITNKFADIADEILDPYPYLAGLTGIDYVVENKVLTRAYSVLEGADSELSYCYGVGQKFKVPFHLPTLRTVGGTTQFYCNLHMPGANGYLCGRSCNEDVIAAVTAAGATLQAIPVHFANTTCGRFYKLMDGYNATNPDYIMGLHPGKYFFSSLMLHYWNPQSCGVCINDSAVLARDPLANITGLIHSQNPAVPIVTAKSRMIICQTDVIAANFILQNEPTTPDDPNECSPTPNPSSDEGESTSSAFSVSLVSCFLAVVAFLAYAI